MIKSTKRFGFTLVELLISIIIIIVLVAILMLSYGAMIDKSKATLCLGNRETIQTAYSMYKLNNSEAKSFDIFLKNEGNIADSWVDRTLGCPSKGTYTAEGNIVICSIHNTSAGPGGPGDPEDPGGGTPSNMIPGTNIGGGTGIFATDVWESVAVNAGTAANPNWNLTVDAGMKFFYNDEYYVAVKNITSPAQNQYSANHQELIEGLAARSSGEGLVKVIGTITEWKDVSAGDTFVRGNIIYDTDGNFYICKLAPGDQYVPILNQWNVRHPATTTHAWFKLE